jgi:hypothetical protein
MNIFIFEIWFSIKLSSLYLRVSHESDLACSSEGKDGERHISCVFYTLIAVVEGLDGVCTGIEFPLLEPALPLSIVEIH